MQNKERSLPWLDDDQEFPPVDQAWDEHSDAPGLLAIGPSLNTQRLLKAYSKGIFPWFSKEQYPLWWSTHPRMVLETKDFHLHHSLKKKIKKALLANELEIAMDHDFETIMRRCGQGSLHHNREGGWIHEDMIEAYTLLHAKGHAHCIEAFYKGESVGGLYAVSIGKMVFGESMYASATDGSKICLAALVAFCHFHQIPLIDCQQNTQHLTFMGGHVMDRHAFQQHLDKYCHLPPPEWKFRPEMWNCWFEVSASN